MARTSVFSFTEVGKLQYPELLAAYQQINLVEEKESEARAELEMAKIKALASHVGSSVARILAKIIRR